MTTRTFFVRVVLLYGCRRGDRESPRKKEKGEKSMELILTAVIAAAAAVAFALIAVR